MEITASKIEMMRHKTSADSEKFSIRHGIGHQIGVASGETYPRTT